MENISFWLHNFSRMNVKKLRSHSVPDVITASDASSTGLGAHIWGGQDRLLLRNTGISFSIRLVPGVGVLGFSGTQDLWQKQCWSVELGGAQGEG